MKPVYAKNARLCCVEAIRNFILAQDGHKVSEKILRSAVASIFGPDEYRDSVQYMLRSGAIERSGPIESLVFEIWEAKCQSNS